MVGVVSFGNAGCEDPAYPSVFGRVSVAVGAIAVGFNLSICGVSYRTELTLTKYHCPY